ncbi:MULTISPECIES: hypothetical protein [unclassified Caballeronia]|uniref:hypothetical protein n=1 Tax=unclassified Caballeronia TaxID=2646786 RepID=UPI002861D3E7|nr:MULTISPECIES: hypothetical protein [unclassified Caballeronia]MDR5739022.1 hypothetical protein [Caballeronia sp. LZ016]MDR5807510.1 hypothetical protein [Caballeronia sp. LZ019]
MKQRRTIVRRDERERGAVGIVRRQCEKRRAPFIGSFERFGVLDSMQRYRRELRQERVPRMPLMRPQRREVAHDVTGQSGEQFGQRGIVGLSSRVAIAQYRIVQQAIVEAHDQPAPLSDGFRFSTPYRP